MTKDLWSAVDRYICDLLVPSDPVLDEVLEESTAAGLPPIAVTPNLGKLLYLHRTHPGGQKHPGDRHAGRLQHDLAGPRLTARRPPDHVGGGPQTR